MDYFEKYDTKYFEKMYYYKQNDLGANYSHSKTIFKLWAPTANSVELLLYKSGENDDLIKKIPLTLGKKGVWEVEVKGDLNMKYYLYEVVVEGKTNFVVDPYAKAAGVNGDRGMVIDLSKTNPLGWNGHSKPDFIFPTDAIIYELHIRDFTIDDNSGIKNRGKYLAFTEKNTKTKSGYSTGIDHLVDLGVTHVHLLPTFDFATVDESKPNTNQYNWGYDPKNYNLPEGSYATNAIDGDVRIKEFKKMIKAFHDVGIRVVMDVVYNHTYDTENSNFHKIIPFYYHRHINGEKFSNGSGCGNELASERLMVRKYIVDSVVFWAKEYNIDGFRFDLMGLHDTETMNEVRKALNEVDPTIIIYGEGWTVGKCGLAVAEQTIKENISNVHGIAVFNDSMRDGIKGREFIEKSKGFVNGDKTLDETIKFSVVAACEHSQVDLKNILHTDSFWAINPTQTVNYVSCHDNHTLWDKLTMTTPNLSIEEREKVHKIALAIVLTSQGIAFMHSGSEFLRTKNLESNTYKSGDNINKIDWNLKAKNIDIYKYIRGLITLRKEHPAFRMLHNSDIKEKLRFWDTGLEGVIAYDIENQPDVDKWNNIRVIYNVSSKKIKVDLPHRGIWNIVVNDKLAGVETIESFVGEQVLVESFSVMVLYSNKVEKHILDEVITRRRTSFATLGIGITAFAVMHTLKTRKRKKKNNKLK